MRIVNGRFLFVLIAVEMSDVLDPGKSHPTPLD